MTDVNKRDTGIPSFSTAEGEVDTYQEAPRETKEQLADDEVKKHWEIRAQRPDVQAVMSARHSLEENREAAKKLVEDIFRFLEGLVEGKRVFELGVGIGRMTAELAKRAESVVGCDMTPQMLERAKETVGNLSNVDLRLGKITDLELNQKFDLVFESIVLLHILNPDELKRTIQKMQSTSDRIFALEHTYEGPDFPISKYSILREPEEYERLFQPYKLVKQEDVDCAGDRFTMMLFEKSKE